MKILINISDETYHGIIGIPMDNKISLLDLIDAVRNGVPLPEGKADVVSMLTELQLEIEQMTPTYHNPDWSITDLIPMSEVIKTIQKKLVMLEK